MKTQAILLGIVAVTLLATVGSVMAAKTSCATIQSGTITDVNGNTISLGYDQWGYNYQAHMFNGFLGNAGRPTPPVTTGDRLMMTWNDAWLSNQDCGTQGLDQGAFTSSLPDHKLDRHYLSSSYIGSGAWLTNHASGQYEGNNYVFGSLTGQYVLSFVLGGTYNHDLFLTDVGGVLSGNGGYPVGGPYSYTWDIISGTVSGNTISFDAVYTGGPDALGTIMHVTGTIQSDGTVSGTWNDNYLGGYREGTWSATEMTVKETCSWSDFVKIVAAPSDAPPATATSECPALYGLDGTMWHTASGQEIGCSIWGSFALIQDVYSNPCGLNQYDQPYHSPFKSGLGIWK